MNLFLHGFLWSIFATCLFAPNYSYRLVQQAIATEPVISNDIIGGKHITCNEIENEHEDAKF